MNANEKALDAVYAALDELNRLRPADQRLPRQPDTSLVGPAGYLDSLGLVTFVVALEQKVEDLLGGSITLTDPALMSETGVFSTVSSLAEYIQQTIAETSHD